MRGSSPRMHPATIALVSASSRVARLCQGAAVRVALVCVAAALAVSLTLRAVGVPGSAARLFLPSLIYALVVGTLASVTLRRLGPRLARVDGAAKWALVIGLLLGLAVVATLVGSALSAALGLVPREAFWARARSDAQIVGLLAVLLGVGMSLYEGARARLQATTLELRTRELEQERARKLALEARLASLESRLSPHFLFNTLNTISALIPEDPARAERAVERLAALLRFSLDAVERGAVPLARELELVVDYLELERARLGERLAYALDVDAEVTGSGVPPLALQTLVENSVKHAVAPRREGGRIRVEAHARGDRLVLGVWDDGPGFTPEAIVPGHGLDVLQGRLSARFGPAATLTVERQDAGTRVTLALPRSPARTAVTA